jgi:hypothetical protein
MNPHSTPMQILRGLIEDAFYSLKKSGDWHIFMYKGPGSSGGTAEYIVIFSLISNAQWYIRRNGYDNGFEYGMYFSTNGKEKAMPKVAWNKVNAAIATWVEIMGHP